jgi:hypothetical protein
MTLTPDPLLSAAFADRNALAAESIGLGIALVGTDSETEFLLVRRTGEVVGLLRFEQDGLFGYPLVDSFPRLGPFASAAAALAACGAALPS